MTDLEICRRIAEIEGIDLRRWNVSPMDDGSYYVFADNGATRNINYLTDDGLCFRLFIKYNVCRELTGDTSFRAVIPNWKGNPEYFRCTASTLSRAICLVIIKAEGGK